MRALKIRALVQPGVGCLIGAFKDARTCVLGTHMSMALNPESAGSAPGPSGLSSIPGSFATATKAARPTKTSRGGDAAREDDTHLIRVVLRKDVRGIGRQGDIVSVKRGKMRHELYPSGDAAYATPENVAKYALTEAEKESRDSNAQEGVLDKLLKALNKKSVILTRRASKQDSERFVGPSVSPENIRRAVLRQLGIQLDPSHFLSEAEIKSYGTFKVPLNLRLPQPDDQQQVELTVHVDRRGRDTPSVAAPAVGTAAAARPRKGTTTTPMVAAVEEHTSWFGLSSDAHYLNRPPAVPVPQQHADLPT